MNKYPYEKVNGEFPLMNAGLCSGKPPVKILFFLKKENIPGGFPPLSWFFTGNFALPVVGEIESYVVFFVSLEPALGALAAPVYLVHISSKHMLQQL